MTLDYKKMFLIVTEEAVVKGHFASAWADSQCVAHCIPHRAALRRSTPSHAVNLDPARIPFQISRL